MKFAKKGTGVTTVTYGEALEVATLLRVDRRAGETPGRGLLPPRFTPRRARSRWSKINRDAATRLIEAGKMKPPGLREVERAQARRPLGRGLRQAAHGRVPDDLERALRRNKQARELSRR